MNRMHLIIASMVTVVLGMNTSLLGPTLSAMAARSGSSLAELGGLFSAISVGYLLGTPLVVLIGRRFGLRPLFAGPVLITASLAIFALAPSLPALLAAAMLLGLAQSFTQTGYSTWIGLRARDGGEAAATLSRVLAFYGVGSLLGPFMASALYRVWNDPLPAFWVMVVPNLAAAALGLMLPTVRPPASNGRHGGVLTLLRTPAVLVLAALLAVYVGAEVGFSSWVTEVVVRTIGVDVAQAALAASAFFAGFAFGRYFAGAVILRAGVQRGLFVLLGIAAVGVVAMLTPGAPLALVVAAAAVVGMGYGPIYPTVAAMAIRRFPEDAATVNSIVGGIASFGMFVLPPLTGQLLVGVGGPLAAWGLQLVLIAAMVMLVQATRR